MENTTLYKFLVVLLFSQFFSGKIVSGGDIRLPVDRLGYNDGGTVRTTRPLIGILTGVGDGYGGQSGLLSDHPYMSHIAASYVKFVESGGARVVPLIYNEPEESLRRKFSAINGILYPGGGADLDGGPYLDTAKKLFKWAIEANDKGDYFPVYGVCLGFEVLSVIIAGRNIMEDCPAPKLASSIQFVDESAKSKGIFKCFTSSTRSADDSLDWERAKPKTGIPEDVLEKFQTEPLSVQNHHFGVKPTTFASTKSLVDFFDVLTVTPDVNGDMYVSAIQGKKYPVTAVMFHPEKNVFEWNYDAIPHSSNAVQITQSIANYVVSETRKSKHSPPSIDEEELLLINNYNSVYIGKNPKPVPFEEIYYFV